MLFRLISLTLLTAPALVIADPPDSKANVEVLFSPKGGCTERIVKEIGEAEQAIRVQAYSFTSSSIAKAILEAKKRGVDCEVILDKSQKTASYSELDFFHNQGVPALVDDRHAIAHNKIILIDHHKILTGSFNFTAAAENENAENLLIIDGNADLYGKYIKNYMQHREHSVRYEGRETKPGDQRGPPAAPDSKEQPKAEQPKTEQVEVTVYVTRTGSKYHTAGCSYLRSSSIPMSLIEARKGYGPCSRCHPPAPD